ncbi:MAG: hypothetical protein AABX86_02145, partial [Nanoarchaeota archaeon]
MGALRLAYRGISPSLLERLHESVPSFRWNFLQDLFPQRHLRIQAAILLYDSLLHRPLLCYNQVAQHWMLQTSQLELYGFLVQAHFSQFKKIYQQLEKNDVNTHKHDKR